MASALLSLAACLRGEIRPDADWDAIITLANKCLVTATLAERVAALPHRATIAGDVRAFLAAIHARNRERNLRLLDQLAQAVTRLNQAGAEPILIKGAALLADSSDDEMGGRMLSDLDLLIPPLLMTDSVAALKAIGYRIETQPTDTRLPFVLSRPQDVGMIDLHNRLRINCACSDYAGLRRHCRLAPVRGKGQALFPSATAQATILILHDQLQDRDYWRGLIDLRHLLDLDRLARSPEGIDWALLVSLFPPGYARAALRTQLRTARDLIGVPVPSELVGGLRPRLQYRRRLLQARRPGLRRLFTTLSLLSDYPRYPHGPPLDDGPAATPSDGAISAARRRGVWRFFQPPAPGKV